MLILQQNWEIIIQVTIDHTKLIIIKNSHYQNGKSF